MPGMNPGLSNTNPTLVAAFRAALLHQGLIVVALLAVLAVLWLAVREFGPAARQGGAISVNPAASVAPRAFPAP